jgi:hypothetical protein
MDCFLHHPQPKPDLLRLCYSTASEKTKPITCSSNASIAMNLALETGL